MDYATFDSWLAGYRRAWENRQVDALAELFAEDATYQESPYSRPMRGRPAIRKYVARNLRLQHEINFRYKILAVRTPRGIAHWEASLLAPLGTRIKLDGILVVSLNEAGRCGTLMEWWHWQIKPNPWIIATTVSALLCAGRIVLSQARDRPTCEGRGSLPGNLPDNSPC